MLLRSARKVASARPAAVVNWHCRDQAGRSTVIAAGEFGRDLSSACATPAHLPLRERRRRRADARVGRQPIRTAAASASSSDRPLRAYDWPGNVRELKRHVELAFFRAGRGDRASIS
jgi:transcriptional regulator with GAF, ATPase, and Fis domain